MTLIPQNLTNLLSLIRQLETTYHRPLNAVQLLAVTKSQPIEHIAEAITAGQTAFAENYLQEALPKIEHFKAEPLEWHFIGKIQRNKTRKIAENFHWVHSVADIHVAERLNEQRPSSLPVLNVCLEVNIDQEKTKSGLAPEEVMALANICSTLPRLKLRGLMVIPAANKSFSEQRETFRQLYLLQQQLKKKHPSLDTLSMGMSDDYEAAIAEGATIIRLGRAIFTRI